MRQAKTTEEPTPAGSSTFCVILFSSLLSAGCARLALRVLFRDMSKDDDRGGIIGRDIRLKARSLR